MTRRKDRRFNLRVLRSALLVIAACSTAAACSDDQIDFASEEHWPEPSLLPAATGARLAFTNSGDDTISILDAASYAPVATIPVGFLPIEPEGPHHLQVSPDGRYLMVGISNYIARAAAATGPHGTHGTGASDGYLLKIDAQTGREVARTRVKRSPGDVRFDRRGALIYQSHFDLQSVVDAVMNNKPRSEFDSFLIATDPNTMERRAEIRICSAGHGVGFSPDDATAYVACWYSDQLAIVDLATQSVERLILGDDAGAPPAPRYQPYALAVSPADGRVFISVQGPGMKGLVVYDPVAKAIDPAARIRTDGAPQFGSFSADGARLYLVSYAPDRLLVIDPATASIARDVDLGAIGCSNAHVAHLSPDETQVWIVCEGDRLTTRGTFHALSTATFEELGQTELGIFPDDVAYIPAP